MIGWLDLYSFALGFIAGCALTAAGFALNVRMKIHRSGSSRRTSQRHIAAGGDVVGGDKTTKSTQ
jgi:pyruvate/2-oxoglutarate dehydrogenase complex dihydrolipoamide dehydrogenase (E3) component